MFILFLWGNNRDLKLEYVRASTCICIRPVDNELRAQLEKPKIESNLFTSPSLKHMRSCVQAALEDLKKLKPVQEEDYKSLVELVNDVEAAYYQLGEFNHLNTLLMRDVDA